MPYFLPWIGPKYFHPGINGVKLLVLGESHYFDQPVDRTFTQEMVRLLAQERRQAFFTRIAKVILGIGAGQKLENEERSQLWNHVAFANYIQSLLPGPRQAPTRQMWLDAEQPFQEVIAELAPQVVLVLGYRLARELPPLQRKCRVCVMQHPSSFGFKYDPWIQNLRHQIEGADA